MKREISWCRPAAHGARVVVRLSLLYPSACGPCCQVRCREASAPWRGTLVFSFETALLALSAKYLQCPQGLTTNHLPENCERIVCRGGFRTRAIVQFYQTGRLQTRLSSPSARAKMASGSRAESLSRNKGAPHWNNRTGLRALVSHNESLNSLNNRWAPSVGPKPARAALPTTVKKRSLCSAPCFCGCF